MEEVVAFQRVRSAVAKDADCTGVDLGSNPASSLLHRSASSPPQRLGRHSVHTAVRLFQFSDISATETSYHILKGHKYFSFGTATETHNLDGFCDNKFRTKFSRAVACP